jgi:uncharacterized protein YuzE
MLKSKKIVLKVSRGDEGVAYLYLPKHPKELTPGIVSKTVAITDLIENYKGVSLYFDFDKDGEIIGIEILD